MEDLSSIVKEDAPSPVPNRPAGRTPWLGVSIMVLLAGAVVPLVVIGKRAVGLDREKARWAATAEERNEELDAQLATKKGQLAGNSAALAADQAELRQVREALTTARGDLAALAKDKEAMAATLAQLREQTSAPAANAEGVAQANQLIKDAEERLAALRTDIAVLDERRGTLRDETDALNRAVLTKKAESADASTEGTLTLVGLRSEQARLLEAISLARQTQEELKVSVGNLTRDKFGTEKELELLKREYERILAKARATTETATDNAERQGEAEGEVAALRAEKAALTKAVADGRAAVGQLNQEQAGKANGVREMREQLAGVRERLTEQLELLVKLQRGQQGGRGAAADKINELEKKVMQTQIRSLEAERNLLLRDVQKLEEQLRRVEEAKPAAPPADGGKS